MSGFSCILVAAGRGNRAPGGVPKQYREIKGRPVIAHSITALLKHTKIQEVIPVIHRDDNDQYLNAIRDISDPRLQNPVFGGNTRSESVKNGLTSAKHDTVLIHDAARPFLPLDALDRLIEAMNQQDAAFLALPVVDALWQGQTVAESSIPRENLWRAQTPQAFRTADLLKAYEKTTQGLDDVAIVKSIGINPAPVLGSEENFKITHPEDFERAEAMLGRTMDIRVGNGFDVHSLGDGDHVILCGIKISHDKAVVGHSDADVAMHSITDAIYGALALGDIGQHFPPSDPQWKGASSDIFLKHATDLAQKEGFKISNIDCTIICEMPKIGPHSKNMRENLASVLGINADIISVKATTSEKLGFTGRGEGIAAQATATLVKI